MDTLMCILGFVLFIVILIIIGIVSAAIHKSICNQCPFRKACEAKQNDKNYVPKCHPYRNCDMINYNQ